MSKARVLYIEDYPVVQEMYVEALKKQGLEVDVAGDGKLALELVQANEYDLILLDLLLPQVSGLEFLREFRKLNKKGEVIVVTDFDNPKTYEEIMKLGVKHYWMKVENTPHFLAERVVHALEDHRAS